MKRALCLLTGLCALLCIPAWPDPTPTDWANDLRAGAGVSLLEEDALLSETASRWAAALASAGMLSHRGADGSTALDRYRRMGGTEARVGEILGAGSSLRDIQAAWEASPSHRKMALKPSWTHTGWGRAGSRDAVVWVVLFSQKLIQGLRVSASSGGLEVRGVFLPAEARHPVLLAGLLRVEASSWDPESRAFSFRLGVDEAAGYLRLGYIGPSGSVIVTNALTWLPGTGSPAEPGRSAAPAEPP